MQKWIRGTLFGLIFLILAPSGVAQPSFFGGNNQPQSSSPPGMNRVMSPSEFSKSVNTTSQQNSAAINQQFNQFKSQQPPATTPPAVSTTTTTTATTPSPVSQPVANAPIPSTPPPATVTAPENSSAYSSFANPSSGVSNGPHPEMGTPGIGAAPPPPPSQPNQVYTGFGNNKGSGVVNTPSPSGTSGGWNIKY